MLFWACDVNLRLSTNLRDRFFPFHLLKDDKHEYFKLKTAFPNEKFKQVVHKVLRNNYKPSGLLAPWPAGPLFNQLCDIFEAMYVKQPKLLIGFKFC